MTLDRPPGPSPVNDLSGPFRAYLACFAVVVGVLAAIFWTAARDQDALTDHPATLAVLVAVVVVLLPGSGVAWVVWLRRADRALKVRLAAGSQQVVTWQVEAEPLRGRAVHHRPDPTSPAWAASSTDPLPAPATTLVVTVLADPPRRVVAQVPSRPEGYPRDTPLRVLAHPGHDDVAVLDDRAGAEELDRIGADPRWSTARLPSNASVLGGTAGLLAVVALALVVGAVVGALALAVA